MAEPRLTVKVRRPPYESPRVRWRELIHAAATAALGERGAVYGDRDRLELDVPLYLTDEAVASHDVDNRLKDIMDALQGRAGGPKTRRRLPRISSAGRVIRLVMSWGSSCPGSDARSPDARRSALAEPGVTAPGWFGRSVDAHGLVRQHHPHNTCLSRSGADEGT